MMYWQHAATRRALRLSLTLAVLLFGGAALDPSGIFAPIGWTGHPVAALWWWAPYLIHVPLALGLAFFGARQLLAEPGAGRAGLVLRLWAVVVLAMAAAALLANVATIMVMQRQGSYVLPLGESLAFLLWSSGYAALKMLVLGWLPASIAAWGKLRVPSLAPAGGATTWPAAFISAACMLALALLGPWMADHFWQGGPMGYVYGVDQGAIAPTPAGMHAAWTLAWMGAALYLSLRRGSNAARMGAAGLFAALTLLSMQALMLALHPSAATTPGEQWIWPALVVRSVDALAFGLGLTLICLVMHGAARALPQRLLKVPALLMAVLAMSLNWHASLPTSSASPSPQRTGPGVPQAASPRDALPRLQVMRSDSGPRIGDENGALVTLRGVNVNQLGEYFQRDPKLPSARPLEEQDFTDIAALGMNMVRLTLSWSLLQPGPNQVSAAYLARIHQAVDWARAHRIYVLLDLHQDAWGVHVDAPPGTQCAAGSDPMIGWDGAPLWATLTDGTAPCQVTGRDLAPNVSRAFQSFYVDRNGIQSSLLQAWQVLGREFAADPAVMGFDLLNEPNFGEQPPIASTLLLANYHARAIAALRAGEDAMQNSFHHLVIFEPSVIWSGFGIDNLPPRHFTPDTQIVFSPHLYNESITADQDFGLTLVSIERGYALAQAAAHQMDVPLWIGEWGYFKSPAQDAPLLKRQVAAEDAYQFGSAFWVWKQGCSDPHVYPGKVAGNIRRMSCPEQQELGAGVEITHMLTRPYLRRHADAGAQWRSDGLSFSVHGQATAGASGCASELWWPGESKPNVLMQGALTRSSLSRVDAGAAPLGPSGGWLLSYCLSRGDYRLDVH